MHWGKGERRGHDTALDGIRGLAILLVLLWHWGVPLPPASRFHSYSVALVSCGWMGVDVFFALSGFLITGILVDSMDGERPLRNFYVRRVLRIFPLYYGVLLLTFAAALAMRLGGYRKFLLLLFYLQNTGLGVRQDQFGIGPFDFGVYWSLAVEEQFYLMWPMVVFLVRDRRKLLWIALSLSMTALVLRTLLLFSGSSRLNIYCWMPCRMDALLIGGALALAMRSADFDSDLIHKVLRWSGWGVAAWISMLLVLVIRNHDLAWFNSRFMQTAGFTIIALGAASLIAWTQRPGCGSFFRMGWLRFFGRYSYGIYILFYLLYAPLYRGLGRDFFGRILHNVTLAKILGILTAEALTVGVAVLSFKFYETPFLKLKRKFEYRNRAESADLEQHRESVRGRVSGGLD
ncbi:MAG: acyltransferase [Acidobacteriota bacterium]|nr:acyltransferase [Acidobacteriota bacterium]